MGLAFSLFEAATGVGGTALLMHATIVGVNSGNPICLLMGCAGGAQQVANATKSNHAFNLGQFETIAAYLANQSGTLGNPTAATTYTPRTQQITFPSFSKTGAFRVMAQLVASGFSQTNTVEAQFQNTLFDGSAVLGSGNARSVYKKNTGYGWGVDDTFISGSTYALGVTVTSTQRVVCGALEDRQFSLRNCFMRLWVIEA